MNPTQYGTAAASHAVTVGYDGVDFDLENLGPGCKAKGKSDSATVKWMVQATLAARAVLGSGVGGGLVTHAPQAPYFGAIGDASSWAGATGCYSGLVASVGSAIDWMNAQVCCGCGSRLLGGGFEASV